MDRTFALAFIPQFLVGGFLPMFFSGYDGMPRRVATYGPGAGFSTPDLISSIGAGIIGLSILGFVYNVARSSLRRRLAADDAWAVGQSLEWAASSPLSRFNFDAAHPIPVITSYAPLHDLGRRGTESDMHGGPR